MTIPEFDREFRRWAELFMDDRDIAWCMDERLTDADAVCGAESFVLLFDRHFRVVHRYVRRRLGADLADELAAETFVRCVCRSREL